MWHPSRTLPLLPALAVLAVTFQPACAHDDWVPASAAATPATASAGDDFKCTQVMGVSVTGDWFNAGFENGLDNGRWQVKWRKKAFIELWADPSNELWAVPVQSACTANADNPDRVIFTGVNWEQTAEPWWEEQFEKVIANIRAKYPSVRRIDLMTMLRAPGNQSCGNVMSVVQPFVDAVHRRRRRQAPRPGLRRPQSLRPLLRGLHQGRPALHRLRHGRRGPDLRPPAPAGQRRVRLPSEEVGSYRAADRGLPPVWGSVIDGQGHAVDLGLDMVDELQRLPQEPDPRRPSRGCCCHEIASVAGVQFLARRAVRVAMSSESYAVNWLGGATNSTARSRTSRLTTARPGLPGSKAATKTPQVLQIRSQRGAGRSDSG